MAATGFTSGDPNKVNRAGDTMTGALSLEYGSINSDVGHDLSLALSVGIMTQSGPISQASATSVLVPAGMATFVSPAHVHSDPKVDAVAFGPVTVELDNPADPLTYFMVDSTGAIVQNAGVPTRAQRRQFAILGRVVVLGGSIVNVQDSPILVAHPLATILDSMQAMGDVRVSGIQLTPIAGTLTFSAAAGEILNLGANNSVDPNDPNVSPFNAQPTAQFRYTTQSGIVDVTPRTLVDPTIYDVGGTVTAVGGGAGSTTIQRVHCFPTQNIFVQLGQNIFGSLGAALDALAAGESGAMPFTTHPDLLGGGVRTGFIVTTRVAGSLTDTANARVLRADQFGNPGGL